MRGKYILKGFFGKYFPFSALNILEKTRIKNWTETYTKHCLEEINYSWNYFYTALGIPGTLIVQWMLMSASKLHFFTPEEVLVINTSSLLSLSKIHCAVFFLFRSTVSSNLEHLTRKGLSNLAQTIFHEKKKKCWRIFRLPWSNRDSTQNEMHWDCSKRGYVVLLVS